MNLKKKHETQTSNVIFIKKVFIRIIHNDVDSKIFKIQKNCII